MPATRTRRLIPLACLLLAGACPAQNGLTGQYFDTAAFGSLKTTRTDPTVNFDWGTTLPAGTALTSADTFAVAWSGQLEPEFSQLYTFHVTADDGALLWVDDRLVVGRTVAATPAEIHGQVALTAGRRVNIRLEYVEQTGAAAVKLEWSSASRAREVIPTQRLFPTRMAKAGGSLLKEHWGNLAGTALADLTAHPDYPAKPAGRELLTSFECLAQSWSDAYGTRVTGYLVPPVSGEYTFAVSGDDVAELYLSTDDSVANRSLIASVAAATGFRDWHAAPTQQSPAVPLVQGRRYYVELRHRETTGDDHWSVGWQPPGEADFSVIPGSALVQTGLNTAQPAQAALLDTLAQDHPRIFATPERFARLRALWQSPAASQPKTWAQNALNSANSILTAAPVAYNQDVRGTILAESRKVVDRMYKLGVAWHLTGDNQYAERAWTELEAVAAFPDWHPAHFLDTAEMTHACGIGYDWFFHYWTPARRETIRTAISNLGLTAGLAQFTGNASWTRSTGNNWNMVCTGGLAVGALALGTENESLTENILHRALNSTRPVWQHFTTDAGAWYEGPGYWSYTMDYGCRLLAGLEWVLGSDFGISSTQGLAESGLAPILSCGPTNVLFNFADAGAGGPPRGPAYQWLARRFGQPLYDGWANQGSGGALDALWHTASTTTVQAAGVPPDMAFHGDAGTAFKPQEMVTLRGRWNDNRTAFIGCKGGEMGAAHGNLDAGTFVLDALGKRWFHDLGGDDYALPGYFSSTPSSGTDRWDYYRMRPEGQNTLAIAPDAGPGMVLNAVAPLISYQSEPGGGDSLAIHDLTAVYPGLTRVWRGTRLTGARDEMVVQDEIQAASGKTVWWFAHFTSPATTVVISPEGTSALLTQGAERLWCEILRSGGTFQVMDAVPLATSPNPAGQNANSGHKKLAIQLANVTDATLAVWFVPLPPGAPTPTSRPAITPLNAWNLAAASAPPVAASAGISGPGDSAVDVDLRDFVTDDSTPPELMRFTLGNPVNGSVTLLADGHTARFTPDPDAAGTPAFNFTATDTTPDSRALLSHDFEPPDASQPLTVPDATGRGRDGTLEVIGTGAATLQADVPAALGRDGRSLDLAEHGSNHAARLVRLIPAGEFNFSTQDWTIAGWFKRRDAASEDMLWHLGTGDGYGTNEELYLMANNAAALTLHHYPGPDVAVISEAAPPGEWHHFAVVRSGTSLSLYLNGALVGTDSSFTLNVDQGQPLVFGGHAVTSGTNTYRWGDVRLDELGVFTAALAPTEVTTLAGGLTVRHFGGLSATGTLTHSATPATSIWINPATGTPLPWSAGGNWSGVAPPASGRGTTLQFFPGQTLAGGTVLSHHDLADPLVLNQLALGGTTAAAATVNLTGGGLKFLNNGGVNPGIALSATTGAGFTYDVALPITLAADTTVSGSGTAALRLSGPLNGAGALIKTNSGTLVLTGSNTHAGDTTIASGTLQIGADGATGTLGGGKVVNNATLRFERTGVLTVPNPISGTGSVYVDCPLNAGTIVLSGGNSFTGNVTVNSGALRITRSEALGTGVKTVTLTNGTAGAPQLRLDGGLAPIALPATISFRTSSNTGAIINEAGHNRLDGDVTLTAGGGNTKLLVAAGSLVMTGNLAPTTTNRTLDLAGAGTGTLAGIIADGAPPNILAVAKNDSGTWILTGQNTWTGKTAVNAGTLVINGSLGAGGTVTVATAAKLAGSGSIAADTLVNGTLQPGDGPGTLTFNGTLAFSAASRLQWELAENSATTGGDAVVATGAVTVTAGAKVDIVLNRSGSGVDFSDPFWTQPRSWPVLAATTVTGGFQLSTLSPDATGRLATGHGTFALQTTPDGVTLVWTPLAPLDRWRFAHFNTTTNSGPAADFADGDADGLPNLLEYAFAGDPDSTSAAPLPRLSLATGQPVMSFLRVPAHTDVTLTVQAADSPTGPWLALAASINGAPFTALAAGIEVAETGTGPTRTVAVTDPGDLPNPLQPRRFYRLSVTR
jgi:autotransporter-associated beta strand protein